jgi:hypothetical protein
MAASAVRLVHGRSRVRTRARQARVSEDNVDGMLDRIADAARRDGRPQDVQVTVENAGTLGIVVGADWSVLNHVPADLDTPYKVSVGDEQSSEPVVFSTSSVTTSQRRCGGTRSGPSRQELRCGTSSPQGSSAGRDLGRDLAAASRREAKQQP